MAEMVAVIMAGGAGTRFWPVSTEERPKQFLQLAGERSLLQESYHRIRELTGPERTLVFTHEAYVDQVREQLPELPAQHIIGEPERRDTAAVNALAAMVVQRLFGPSVLAILTADHWIHPLECFHEAVSQAAVAAEVGNCLYTLGIRPSYPATCYGYLELGQELDLPQHFQVRRFQEKPDLATARKYVESGGYLWNSGMFFWRTDTILAQFQRHLPAHLEGLTPAVDRLGDREALRSAFQGLQKISVDYAILEKAEDVRCLVPTFEWSDLGGWLALEPFMRQDPLGNHHRGQLASRAAQGNLVYCDDDQELVALLGVQDLIVVRSGKTTLILSKERTEEVKQLLAALEERRG